jgi:hypothetical protein
MDSGVFPLSIQLHALQRPENLELQRENGSFVCLHGVEMAHSKNVHSTMKTLQVYMMHKSSFMCDTGSLGVRWVLPMIVSFGNI